MFVTTTKKTFIIRRINLSSKVLFIPSSFTHIIGSVVLTRGVDGSGVLDSSREHYDYVVGQRCLTALVC